jgi:YD repeat-containing protein
MTQLDRTLARLHRLTHHASLLQDGSGDPPQLGVVLQVGHRSVDGLAGVVQAAGRIHMAGSTWQASGDAVDEAEGATTRKLLYTYDVAGRLVAEHLATAVGQCDDDACGEDSALIAANAYHANGNRLGRDKPGGDVDEEAEYDAQDRLVDYAGIAHTFGDPGELQAARDAWGFDQDAMGHLLQASKPAYLSSSPRGGHVFGAW